MNAPDGTSRDGTNRDATERASGERGNAADSEPVSGNSPESASAADPGIETVERVSGTGVPVRGNDIDTDQIIPARFMKVVTFDGLGQFAFHDQRFTEADEPKDHPFNDECFRDGSVLVVNANFGCGSSREHAPQALVRWGIDAIVGESFAEIFAGNCLALGVPTVTADAEAIDALQNYVESHPDAEIEVDVASESVRYDGTEIDAAVDDAQRKALVEGVWDTTALLGSNSEAVAETARSLPYVEAETAGNADAASDGGNPE